MLGWQLINSYSPLLGLLAGVVTGIGLLGLGLLFLRKAQMPEPWRGVTAYLLGVLSASLLFELIAIAGWATKPVLVGGWVLVSAVGIGRFVPWMAQQKLPRSYVVAALLGLHLLVAMAPVSHQDELDYHALVTARVVQDQGLIFYTAPWEAAVWPQLAWHILQAPLFAMGVPQASGVLSWFTTLILAWLVFGLVTRVRLAELCCVALLAQGFSISQFTAMGPHAFGYLATTVALLAMLFAPVGVGWILPVAATAMIAGKLTMAPAAVVLCVVGLRRDAWKALVAVVIFFGPICFWMWAAWKPFDTEALSIYHVMKAFSISGDNFLPVYEAANWSLLLWTGCAAYFLYAKRDATLWIAAFLVALQGLLVWFVIAKQLRFLGGLQYGFCVAGAIAAGHRYAAHRYSKWLWVAAVPWVCMVVWMGSAFVPVSLTFTSPRAFLERYTGLFQDYEALDRILPAEAVILQGRSRTDERQIAWLSKPPAFYSPRPMLFQSSDLQGEPAYLLYVEGAASFDLWIPAGYRLGERVYRDEHARFYPNRTPSAGSDMERIAVYRLLRLR